MFGPNETPVGTLLIRNIQDKLIYLFGELEKMFSTHNCVYKCFYSDLFYLICIYQCSHLEWCLASWNTKQKNKWKWKIAQLGRIFLFLQLIYLFIWPKSNNFLPLWKISSAKLTLEFIWPPALNLSKITSDLTFSLYFCVFRIVLLVGTWSLERFN